jgi:GTP-binding protein HflX
VAVVGYTNAGKSTLLNTLTQANVLVEDKLFATLDPTVRKLKLSGKHEVLMSDTVGFIQRLPHPLIAAFKATLEEVVEADLLLHMIDVSHPHMENQRAAVQKVLEELGADKKPQLEVYNKLDLLADQAVRSNGSDNQASGVFISALRRKGIPDLIKRMEAMLFSLNERWDLLIPVGREDLLARLYQFYDVRNLEHQGRFIRLEAEIPRHVAEAFSPFRIDRAGQGKSLSKEASRAQQLLEKAG